MERKEAIEVVKKNWPDGRIMLSEALMTLIPELKESEDENIKQRILEYFKDLNKQGYETEKWISWIEKQEELIDKPTKEQVWDYCSKISNEWWQITMDRWNSLTDEERKKYNQFIGFNDFSDMLMNITAGALFQLINTGKLEYEEGSLLLEKPKETPKPLEVTNETQGEQEQKSFITENIKMVDDSDLISELESRGYEINKYE